MDGDGSLVARTSDSFLQETQWELSLIVAPTVHNFLKIATAINDCQLDRRLWLACTLHFVMYGVSRHQCPVYVSICVEPNVPTNQSPKYRARLTGKHS